MLIGMRRMKRMWMVRLSLIEIGTKMLRLKMMKRQKWMLIGMRRMKKMWMRRWRGIEIGMKMSRLKGMKRQTQK